MIEILFDDRSRELKFMKAHDALLASALRASPPKISDETRTVALRFLRNLHLVRDPLRRHFPSAMQLQIVGRDAVVGFELDKYVARFAASGAVSFHAAMPIQMIWLMADMLQNAMPLDVTRPLSHLRPKDIPD